MAGDLHVGENIKVNSNQNALYDETQDKTTGSIQTAGGIAADQDIFAQGGLYTMYGLEVSSGTESSSITSGSIITDGGVGVGKDVFVGQDLTVENDFKSYGDIDGDGKLDVRKSATFHQEVNMLDTTEASYDPASNDATGSIRTRGGIFAAKDVMTQGHFRTL